MSDNKAIRNAKVWTADKSNPWAECIVVRDNKIAFAGTYNDAEEFIDEKTEVIDAGGKMIIPSFIDSHTHTSMLIRSSWLEPFDFEGCQTMDEVMKMVADYIGDRTPEEFPYVYADPVPTELIEKEHADKHIVDKYVSDRPVLLSDTSFHQCIANSKMLELMEITKDTPYNEESAANYLRDEKGEPNGVILERLHEFNGDIQKMYEKIGWEPPRTDDIENIRKVYKPLCDYGISAIAEGFTDEERDVAGVKMAIDEGIYKGYFAPLPKFVGLDDLEKCIQTAKDWQDKYGSEYIIVDTVKCFVDGTNEVGTGAYVEPIEGTTDNYGEINISEEDLTQAIRRLNEEGLSLQLHIVGDRGYRSALNAVDKVKSELDNPEKDFRIRVTLLHCEMIHPEDVTRAAQKGVFVNVTTAFAAGEFGDAAKEFVGEERFNNMFAYNDVIKAGACVNFSADAVDFYTIPYINPFRQIGYGITRSIPEMNIYGRPKEENKFSLEDMLTGLTINNAKGMGIDHKTGSIEAGKMANFLIISKNLFEATEEEIFETKVEEIYFEGEKVL